ncbi:MAG TPA: hypothetical protein VMR51_03590 [Patescibacteria group bacterium]|nr:hypothetical protein [Patescibacteria group bacterium]
MKQAKNKPVGSNLKQQNYARRVLVNLKPRRSKSKTNNKRFKNWWQVRRWWQKIGLVLAVFVLLFTAQAYGVALWYQHKHRGEPLVWGVTFVADYARYLDLNAKDTFLALRDDLGFRRFRLVSFWDDSEKVKGTYDFSELDWQFSKVNEVNGQVTLAIGLRQPRWPECHEPDWAKGQPKSVWYPALKKYMTAVVNRYKNNPALKSYQLENEYFLSVFANCGDSSRDRLIEEFNLVKQLDPNHPIIISLSNNYLGVPVGKPRADEFGVSVYKRVWDRTITHRYFEYPFPSWYYSWRAGWTEILTGKESMLHELQAEPWPPNGLKGASIAEQSKSMDAKRLTERIKYGEDTGFRDIDLWGGEWWYWRKVKFNDPSLWNTIKQDIPNPGGATTN